MGQNTKDTDIRKMDKKQSKYGGIFFMIMNIKDYDNQIKKITTDIATANTKITKNVTDIASANTRITKNATDITTANGRITQNASAISTLNSGLSTLTNDFNKVSTLAYNNLCYVSVISIAQSSSYVFESPFLRGIFVGQINNFVHIVHVARDGVFATAEGFKTENMSLMSVSANGNAVTIRNQNADNVLRVFVLFK